MLRFTGSLALLSLLAACGGSSGGDLAEAPRLRAERDLRIGSVDDSATALTRFRQLVVGADGRIYTLHPTEKTVRIHDAQGSPAGSFGRDGSGPGEFRNPAVMGWRADTLWVLDFGNYRFNLFDADGVFLRTRSIPVDLGGCDRAYPPRPNGLLADGAIHGSPPAFSSEIADGTMTRNYAVRFDSAGGVADTIAEYSVANTTWRLADPNHPRGLQSFRQQPFSDTELVRISPMRPEVVRVERAVALAADRAEFTVTKTDLRGDTIWSRAFAYAPQPLPSHLPDSLARDFAKGMENLPPAFAAGAPTPARAFEFARASLWVPAFLPPIRNVVLGADGSSWLQREQTTPDASTWWILDEDGRLLGEVQLPAQFTVQAATRDDVWGMETDDLDIPYIARYRVEPGGR